MKCISAVGSVRSASSYERDPIRECLSEVSAIMLNDYAELYVRILRGAVYWANSIFETGKRHVGVPIRLRTKKKTRAKMRAVTREWKVSAVYAVIGFFIVCRAEKNSRFFFQDQTEVSGIIRSSVWKGSVNVLTKKKKKIKANSINIIFIRIENRKQKVGNVFWAKKVFKKNYLVYVHSNIIVTIWCT